MQTRYGIYVLQDNGEYRYVGGSYKRERDARRAAWKYRMRRKLSLRSVVVLENI